MMTGPVEVVVPPTVDDLGPQSTSSSTLPNATPIALEALENEGLAHMLEPEPPTIAREPQGRQPPSVSLLQTMPLGMPSPVYPEAVAPTARAQPAPFPSTGHVPIPIIHHSAPPSHPEPLPYPYSDEPAATRTGYFVAAFVGLVLAVVIGGGGFWLFNGRLRPRPAPAPAVPAKPSAAAIPTVPVPVTAVTATPSVVPPASAEPASDADAAAAAVKPHRPRPKAAPEPKEKEPPKEPAPKESGNLPDNPY